VVDQQLLRESLFPRDDHAARVAPRVGHPQQLEQAHDILVEEDVAVELLEQVEHDVRLEIADRVTDGK
jgi:hypothetical protein